jgi:hypothetical protein
MKKSKFTDAQIAFVLRQAEDGTAIGEVCRKTGISEATFYNWREEYGGLMPSCPATHAWTALAGVFQRYSGSVGRVPLTDFTRLAGCFLPIPLCGRTSL